MFSLASTRPIYEDPVRGRISGLPLLVGLLALCGILLGTGTIHGFAAGAPKGEPVGQGGVAAPGGVPCFAVVDSANTEGNFNTLRAVEALAPDDVWAVGYAGSSAGTKHLLVEHWNGTAWSVTPVAPPAEATNSYLEALTAVSPNDIWAVGYYFTTGMLTLTLHWDGTAWTQVPSVNVSGYNNYLNAVDARKRNDVWAVGYYDWGGGPTRTHVMHWDGSRWAEVVDAEPEYTNYFLYGVTAIAPDDVWAVGYYSTATAGYQTFVEHWNGAEWSVSPSPNIGADNYLNAVSAAGPKDVWAVGRRVVSANTSNPIMLHWNGTAWSSVLIPYSGSGPGALMSVTALGPFEVYAAGYFYSQSQHKYQPYVLHWDGFMWTMTGTQQPGYRYNYVYDVAALPGGDTWTVGNYYTASMLARTLIEHNNCGAPTPILVGHVTWQGRPGQPDPSQRMPISLNLKLGEEEAAFTQMTTDASGFFTVSLAANMPVGTYDWTLKGPQYLAEVGQVTLEGGPITRVEAGLMRGGDANNDDVVDVSDFAIVKASFGAMLGDPNYDDRADFTGDALVNIDDFMVLKANFGNHAATDR